MKRPQKQEDGFYHINGKKYQQLFGSRAQVWNDTAYKTEGNLVKSDLLMNKHRRIVSKIKYNTAKKEQRLKKYGYGTIKGRFGYVKIAPRRRLNGKTRKSKFGSLENKPFV